MEYYRPHDAVETDYFTDNLAIGGTSEEFAPFTFTTEGEGATMKKIEAWKDDSSVQGVKVWMTNGSSHLAGNAEKWLSHSEFELAADELITKLILQPSELNYRRSQEYGLGAIWMQTNKDRKWEVRSNGSEGTDWYEVDVGSGLCCGIFGYTFHGRNLVGFGMAMLREVESVRLDNVKYPYLKQKMVFGRFPDFYIEEDFDNTDGSEEKTFTLKGTKHFQAKKSWSTKSTLGVSDSVRVKAGIPFVEKVDGDLKWSVGDESNHSMREEERRAIQYQWPVEVSAGTKVNARGEVYADKVETEFTGKMNLLLDNGAECCYFVRGEYCNANYTRVDLTVTKYE